MDVVLPPPPNFPFMLQCWTLSLSLFYCAGFLCWKGKCLSKPAAESTRLLISACLFVCAPSFINLDIVSAPCVTHNTQLDPRAPAASAFYVCHTRTHCQVRARTHARGVSVSCFLISHELSSCCGLSGSSWFVWVSVVTAQRPAPGEPDLSAVCES